MNLNKICSPIKRQNNIDNVNNNYISECNPYRFVHKLINKEGLLENSDSYILNIHSINESPIKERNKVIKNPVENMKKRYKMEIKKSYATNIYGSNPIPIKKERINQKSIFLN